MRTKASTLFKLSSKYRISRLALLRIFSVYAVIAGIASMAFAQTAKEEGRGITLEEYTKVKTFTPKNLDEDTYVKFENTYILDRYQMKPPYTFKYSDGIERRIYLYKLIDNKTRKDLGMVAIYHTPANGKSINLCIPNAIADKEVWAKYIDDLKDNGDKEKGFLSTVSYVLSREMSTMLGNGGGQANSTAGSKTDYDVCFPENAVITLANGSEKQIKDINAGDWVAAFNQKTGKIEHTVVQEVQVHEKVNYSLTSVKLVREELTASLSANGMLDGMLIGLTLEATSNHPVLTKEGRKTMGELNEGDYLYSYDNASGEFVSFRVQEVTKDSRTTNKVYNLVTEKENYIVNNTVVLDK